MNRTVLLIIVLTLISSCRTNTEKQKNMNNIRSEVSSKTYVELKAEIVWEKLIAFGGTEKFVPKLIEKVTVKGDGIGAIRNIYLKGGGEIIEELTKIDNKKMYMEFIILSTPMPITKYTGIFKVNEISNNRCEVKFSSKYNVSLEQKNEMKSVIKGFQETFISNLDK